MEVLYELQQRDAFFAWSLIQCRLYFVLQVHQFTTAPIISRSYRVPKKLTALDGKKMQIPCRSPYSH